MVLKLVTSDFICSKLVVIILCVSIMIWWKKFFGRDFTQNKKHLRIPELPHFKDTYALNIPMY